MAAISVSARTWAGGHRCPTSLSSAWLDGPLILYLMGSPPPPVGMFGRALVLLLLAQ